MSGSAPTLTQLAPEELDGPHPKEASSIPIPEVDSLGNHWNWKDHQAPVCAICNKE